MNKWTEAREQMRQRIIVLDLLQRELSDRSGLSMATWTQLLNGPKDTFAPRTLRQASTALGWTPDSLDRILKGGAPVSDLGSQAVHDAQYRSDMALLNQARTSPDINSVRATGDHVSPYAPGLAELIASLVDEVQQSREESRRGFEELRAEFSELKTDVTELKKKAE